MKNPLLVVLVLACAVAGCSTATVTAQTGSLPPSGAQAGISIQGGSATSVIVTVAALAALIGLSTESASSGVPHMLEGRSISEVDCTQPIQDWSKNLRCR